MSVIFDHEDEDYKRLSRLRRCHEGLDGCLDRYIATHIDESGRENYMCLKCMELLGLKHRYTMKSHKNRGIWS